MALVDSLVAYYKLDESSGNASDSFGGNTGTVTNITYSAGKINNCAVFNGTSSDISVPVGVYSLFDGTKSWTISAWVYPTNLTGNHTIFRNSSGDANNGFNSGVSFFSSASNINILRANGGSSVANQSTATLTINTWNYVTATYDGTNVSLYINAGTPFTQANAISGVTAVLGRFGRWVELSTSYYWWAGNIDETAFYNRALTSTEVSQLYNSGAGLQYGQGAFTLPESFNNYKFVSGASGISVTEKIM